MTNSRLKLIKVKSESSECIYYMKAYNEQDAISKVVQIPIRKELKRKLKVLN